MNDQQNNMPRDLIYVKPVGDYNYAAGDEISLVDLVGVLFRRKRLILFVTLIFVCLSFAITSIKSEKYRADTMIEIGLLFTADDYETVESPEAVKNRILSLARSVAGKMHKEAVFPGDGPMEGPGFSTTRGFKIDVPANGRIISMELTAPKEAEALFFLSRINRELIENHDRIFSQRRMELENDITRKALAASDIDIAINRISNQIAALKRHYDEISDKTGNRIKELEGLIKNTELRKTSNQEKIGLLKQEKESLTHRIEEMEARYERLIEARRAAGEKIQSETPLALMIFNREVQDMGGYLAELRNRLLFEIPENISALETDLHELDARTVKLQAEKELERKRIEQLAPELKEKKEDLKGRIEVEENKKENVRIDIRDLKNQKENMMTTQVIASPEFSGNRVYPNLKLNLLLGLALGVFISVFLVFAVEFWQRNKDAIKAGGK